MYSLVSSASWKRKKKEFRPRLVKVESARFFFFTDSVTFFFVFGVGTGRERRIAIGRRHLVSLLVRRGKPARPMTMRRCTRWRILFAPEVKCKSPENDSTLRQRGHCRYRVLPGFSYRVFLFFFFQGPSPGSARVVTEFFFFLLYRVSEKDRLVFGSFLVARGCCCCCCCCC